MSVGAAVVSLLVSGCVGRPCGRSCDVRLMSFNIRMGCGHDDPFVLEQGSLGHLPKCAEVIREGDPDAVGLQEVDRFTVRAGGVDQTAAIAGLTSLHGMFVPKIPHPGGDYGIALLARKKPLSVESALLQGSLHTRVLEICEFDDYVVANTHFPLADWACTNAARTVCARLRPFAARKPVFLMGDFNSTPDSETLRVLRNEFVALTDARAFTFPAKKPDRTIDYVFVDKAHAPSVRVRGRRVLAVPEATDHCALVVDVSIGGKASEL